MCQAYPTFYSDYNAKSLLNSVSEIFYENFIVTQDYCVSDHSSFCSFKKCNFHVLLIRLSLEQIFQRLYKYHLVYQIVNCNYALLN